MDPQSLAAQLSVEIGDELLCSFPTQVAAAKAAGLDPSVISRLRRGEPVRLQTALHLLTLCQKTLAIVPHRPHRYGHKEKK
jgi:hypothetical protein